MTKRKVDLQQRSISTILDEFMKIRDEVTGETQGFFRDQDETALLRTLTVLKAIENDSDAKKHLNEGELTLEDVDAVLSNDTGRGNQLVELFQSVPTNTYRDRVYNDDTAHWILGDYYSGSPSYEGGLALATKTYEHAQGIRETIKSLIK